MSDPLSIALRSSSMSRTSRSVPFLALALSLGLAATSEAAVRTWDGGAGTLSWTDANNWSPDGVPTASDDVVIDVPGQTVTITLATGSSTVNTIASNENLQLGGTLTIASTSAISGLVTVTGTLGGAGAVTFNGGLTLSGGTLTGTGLATVPSGATVAFDTGTNSISKILEVAGSANWTAAGINFSNGTLNILAGGVFNASATANLANFGGSSSVNNAGTLNKSGGATTVSVLFNNTGVVNVDGGMLTVAANGTNSGTFDVDSGAALSFGGNYTHAATALLTGSGTIAFTNGTHVLPAGSLAPTGTVSFSGGTVTVNNTIPAATIDSVIGASLVCNADQTFPNVTISGTLGGSGNVSFPSGLTLAGANLTGTGVATVPSGATIAFNTGTNSISKVLEIAGTANWTAAAVNFNSGTLNILAGGVFNASATANLANFGGSSSVNNAGTLNKSGGATTISILFNNTGVVNVDGGTLAVTGSGTGSGTFDVDSGATLSFGGNYTHAATALLTGSGTIAFTNGTHVLPAGSLAPTGTVSFSGGSVTLNNTIPSGTIDSAIGATLLCNASQAFPNVTISGTLGGSGNVSFPSGVTLAGANLTGAGVATVPSGATIAFSTGANTISRVLEIAGTANWTTAAVNFNNGTLNILAGGVFNALATANLANFGGSSSVNNAGTFNKSGGATTISILFNNTGVVNVNGGTLTVSGSGTNAGTVDVHGGATLLFNGNETYTAGSLLTGAGTISFAGGTHTFPAGSLAPSGTLNFLGGTITINNTIPVNTIANQLFGTVNFNANQTFPNVTLNGAVGGSGNLSFPSGVALAGANLSGTGIATVPFGATATLSTGTSTIGRVLEIGGTANWTASNLNFNNGTINVLAGGVFNATGTGTLGNFGGSSAFNNAGTFSKSAGATTCSIPFTNSGDVIVSGGSFTSTVGYVQTAGSTILNGGTFTKTGTAIALQGGVLGGVGTLTGTVAQTGGSIAPGLSPGTLTVTGSLTQNATSMLDIELGGLTPGTEHDRLAVSGAATIAGTLRLQFVNGFVPHFGDSFTVLTASSVNGTYATIDVVGYPDCVASATYTGTSVTVVIESVPPTAVCRNIDVNLSAAGAVSITADQVDNGSADNCAIASLAVAPNSFTCANLGANIVTLTVKDHAQNVSTCQAIVTVHDVTAPVIASFPADAAFGCSGQIPAPDTSLITATDSCGPIIITHLGDSGNGGAGCAASPLVVTRTYRVADGSGNVVDRNQLFTVIDVTPPSITSFPANQSLSCPGQIPPANVGSVSALDGCGGTVLITHLGDVSNGGAGCAESPLIVTRTYRASDACGNAVTQSQTFTVIDVTAPTIQSFPADQSLQCASEIPAADIGAVLAVDDCDPAVIVTHEGDITNGGSGCSDSPLVVTRTYRATDACGHFVEQSQHFTIIDTTAPIISATPANGSAAADCGSAPLPDMRGELIASDNCATLTVEQSPAPGTALPVGTHTITFTVRDACQNEASTTASYVVTADTCPADFDHSGDVGAADLAILLGTWGPCDASCCTNLDGDTLVSAGDLALLLGAWGPCPAGHPNDANETPAKPTKPTAEGPVADGGDASPAAPASGGAIDHGGGASNPSASAGADPSIGAATPGADVEQRVIEVTADNGILVIEGDLTLTAADRTILRVHRGAGIVSELIVVTGTAFLDGTLAVEVIDDGAVHDPLPAWTPLTFLVAGEIQGQFAAIEFAREGAGLPEIRGEQRRSGSALLLVIPDAEATSGGATAAPTASPDLNGDGAVDVHDLVLLLHSLGSQPATAEVQTVGDLNGDGTVDASDLALLVRSLATPPTDGA